MGDPQFRDFVTAAEMSDFVALAFHALVFGSVIALLARARSRLAKGSKSRAAAWTLFVVLALASYVFTAVPAWALDEHLLFWKTGIYSICHLSGFAAKIAPLLVGLLIAAVDRPLTRRFSLFAGGALALLGTGFALVACYRWLTFSAPTSTDTSLIIGPLRESLLAVVAAATVVVVTGCIIVRVPRTAAPANCCVSERSSYPGD